MDVVLEPDATPLVRIIATTLRDSAADPDVARKAKRLRGVFVLRSEKDPQAVTMRFDRGRVALSRGVAPDAQVVVTVDLDNMSGPDAPKPMMLTLRRLPCPSAQTPSASFLKPLPASRPSAFLGANPLVSYLARRSLIASK